LNDCRTSMEVIMKVLVLSVTAGQGHNATAKALCAYLESVGCEAVMLDTLEYLNHILGETVARGYLLAASKAKLAYKGGYRLAEKRHKSKPQMSLTRGTGKVLGRKLIKYIDNCRPDVIICTHVVPAMILDILKENKELYAKTVGILTDFMFHPFWEETLNLDYVVTPSEQLMFQARRKGFEKTQVLPFGIPIHPKFSECGLPKEQARTELGLDPNKRTVLLMSGSMGYGNIKQTVLTLDRLPIDFQLITVCGNNTEAKAGIDAMKTRKRVLNLGFVDNVEKLMDASDCIISKPGGLTTSEALAKGLPMIIVDPIPGQEDRNTEFLTNNGVAMSVTSTSTLDDIMYQMLADPRRMELMRESIKMLAKPNSTRDICEFVKELAKPKNKVIIKK